MSNKNNTNNTNKIKKNIDETEESYKRRLWFISLLKPKTKDETKNAILLANIWINMIILKCIYPKPIMEKIHIIVKNANMSIKKK